MSSHLIDGEFQSDKYPTTPRGKVPLSVKDPMAQDLLWMYAQRRRAVDAEFSEDLETALRSAGYAPQTIVDIGPTPGAMHWIDPGMDRPWCGAADGFATDDPRSTNCPKCREIASRPICNYAGCNRPSMFGSVYCEVCDRTMRNV